MKKGGIVYIDDNFSLNGPSRRFMKAMVVGEADGGVKVLILAGSLLGTYGTVTGVKLESGYDMDGISQLIAERVNRALYLDNQTDIIAQISRGVLTEILK
jgi:hypothetical protein